MEIPEIAKIALTSAREAVGPVLVVSDDTDVAAMLQHHYRDGCSDVHLLQVTRSKALFSIQESQAPISDINSDLLFGLMLGREVIRRLRLLVKAKLIYSIE